MIEHERSTDPTRATASSLIEVLRQLAEVVGGLSGELYAAKSGEAFSGSSIGGHVRHTLDHVRAMAEGVASGEIDYDHRERGTGIEFERTLALAEIRRLSELVEQAGRRQSGHAVEVVYMASSDGRALRASSTVARELAFVLSHTIHHAGMIRAMAKLAGASVPARFGYAPSTLAYQAEVSAVARG